MTSKSLFEVSVCLANDPALATFVIEQPEL